MPRTRYTRLVHEHDEIRQEEQIRALRRLAHELHRQPTDVVEMAMVIDLKDRRRARLEQNRRHKPARTVTTVSA
ncbi:hypothetical protein [Amycolatopsis alkalitolerans]|uniref:Uncharacterized protein n=1 Tax=Amycolatopsis alkalitolerans TaxID=2547244 RepID=A0A5C4LWA5_9PSEU|nr:hypothetical protein [Amycolatopsis alkalitolerans]TNC23711.1 hypothetical protein FG385_20315 [Amycolatopsis alkalitolerans]